MWHCSGNHKIHRNPDAYIYMINIVRVPVPIARYWALWAVSLTILWKKTSKYNYRLKKNRSQNTTTAEPLCRHTGSEQAGESFCVADTENVLKRTELEAPHPVGEAMLQVGRCHRLATALFVHLQRVVTVHRTSPNANHQSQADSPVSSTT